LLFAAVLALMTPGVASAAPAKPAIPFHAKLGHADPGIGSVLGTAPSRVTLQFIENVVPLPASAITVLDAKGNTVSDATTSFSASKPNTLSVGMKGNGSDFYVVYFHTVSVDDGDAYADAYQFTVSSSATASSGRQPDAAGDSVSNTPATTVHNGVSPVVAALIGIVGLIVGAAVGFLFAARRGAAGGMTRETGSSPLPN
jgi:copper transport protein